MLGSIIGDICGSVYEWHSFKTENPDKIPLNDINSFFTDDSVLTVATAEAILTQQDYASTYKKWARRYPNSGYGGDFYLWMKSDCVVPYYSWGNGSAMRVSPVGWAFETLEETLAEAKRSAEVTHDHPEGIKGAQATAAAIFMARHDADKPEIKRYIESTFGYNLSRATRDIRPGYSFDVSCQGSVPESIISFLESRDYEHAVRLAISLGGDADTMACIAGGIAEAFYREIPEKRIYFARMGLAADMLDVIDRFTAFLKTGNADAPPANF